MRDCSRRLLGVGRTLNCRVVFVHKVTLDQLNCEAALSDATTSYDHQLIFPEELRHLLALLAAKGVTMAHAQARRTFEAIVSRSMRAAEEAKLEE